MRIVLHWIVILSVILTWSSCSRNIETVEPEFSYQWIASGVPSLAYQSMHREVPISKKRAVRILKEVVFLFAGYDSSLSLNTITTDRFAAVWNISLTASNDGNEWSAEGRVARSGSLLNLKITFPKNAPEIDSPFRKNLQSWSEKLDAVAALAIALDVIHTIDGVYPGLEIRVSEKEDHDWVVNCFGDSVVMSVTISQSCDSLTFKHFLTE